MMRVRIGNQTSFSAVPISGPFEYAVAHGFDAFEWFPDKKESGEGWTADDISGEMRSTIRETARTKGISLSVHASLPSDPLRPDAGETFMKDAGFARDIGAQLFNIHFYPGRRMDAYVKSIFPLMDLLSRSGIRLSIENTHGAKPQDFNRLFKYLRNVNPPYISSVGMCLDIGHANLCETTRNDYLRYVDLLDPRVPIIHLHLHENYGDYDSHLPIFTGPAGKDPSGMEGLIKRLMMRRFSGAIIFEQWPIPPDILDKARDKLLGMIGDTPTNESINISHSVSFPLVGNLSHKQPPLTSFSKGESEGFSPQASRRGDRTSRSNRGISAITDGTPDDNRHAGDAFVKAISEADKRLPGWRKKLEWIYDFINQQEPGIEQLVYIAIYFRFIGAGAIRCGEDEGHHRPSNHARVSQKIYGRLSGMTTADNIFVIRKIYPWLPSFASPFMRSEPLTRIRDIAHRNDIPPELKKEIKVSLQNKLHRSAGPEDLVTSEALLKKITAPGASYPAAFVEEFGRFHEELKEFFNARSLNEQLIAFMEGEPGEVKDIIKDFLKFKEQAKSGAKMLAVFKLLTELRGRFSANLNKSSGSRGHQIHLIDIALEDFSFSLLSRIINYFDERKDDLPWDLSLRSISFAIRNLRLSGFDYEECLAIESELREWSANFDKKDVDQLLRLKATLDRCGRLAEIYTGKMLALFPERVEKLGRSLGVSGYVIKAFVEGDVRGHPVFQLSRLVTFLIGKIRSLAALPPWDVIVPGTTSGLMISTFQMTGLSNTNDGPVIALLDKIEGDEEIPAGVSGIIVPHETPSLSHLSVRARQGKIVFASCYEQRLLSELKNLAGKHVVLSVSSEKFNFNISPNAETSLMNDLYAKGVRGCIPVSLADLSSGQRLNLLTEISPASGGDKAFGAAELEKISNLSGADFKTPMGAVIPFGVLEESLRLHRESEKEYRDLVEGLDKLSGEDLTHDLNRLKEIIYEIQVPGDIISDIYKVFGKKERLIVRSSSNCEDGQMFSGAGVFDSVPNVRPPEAAQAIRKVWASLWNRIAVAGRKRAGIDHDDAHMAVLIQRMIIPEFSFIIHTTNPVTGNRAELYLEAVAGLGETLTSGKIPGGPYRMALNKDSESIRMIAFASFSSALLAGPEEEIFHKTIDYSSIDFSRDASFRNRTGTRLGRIGRFVEDAFKGPQDIEGVISGHDIYLVQSRPQQGEGSQA